MTYTLKALFLFEKGGKFKVYQILGQSLRFVIAYYIYLIMAALGLESDMHKNKINVLKKSSASA